MSPLVIPLVLAACVLVAWTVATIVVGLADRLGLVYSERAEARRHDRDRDLEPPAPRVALIVAREDLAEAVQAALAAPPPEPAPIRRRIDARRATFA